MRVVSDNTEKDIAKHRLEHEVEWAMRELTANLLRITRGAGKSYDVLSQAHRLIDLSVKFKDLTGVWPYSEMERAICMRGEGRFEPHVSDFKWAEHSIVAGALQLTAATLLGQHLQQASGGSQMYDGINELEREREERRAKRAADSRAALAGLRAAQRAKKPKPKTKRKPTV